MKHIKNDQNRNIFDLFSLICWLFEGKKIIYIDEQGKPPNNVQMLSPQIHSMFIKYASIYI